MIQVSRNPFVYSNVTFDKDAIYFTVIVNDDNAKKNVNLLDDDDNLSINNPGIMSLREP